VDSACFLNDESWLGWIQNKGIENFEEIGEVIGSCRRSTGIVLFLLLSCISPFLPLSCYPFFLALLGPVLSDIYRVPRSPKFEEQKE
jgi:hypothetical protein